jgi:hypothetical protein
MNALDRPGGGDLPSSEWGEASKIRGQSNMQMAMDFVTAFPVGTELNISEFDQWAHASGLLVVPSADASKNSDAWKAHLQRRHELRYRINNAGSHPRLRDNGSTPFTLDKLPGGGMYAVRAPHAAVAMSEIPGKVASFLGTKRRKLGYLMQSEDWDNLPPYERIVAETIFDDIDRFRGLIEHQVRSLESKFSKLESRLRRAVGAGQITSTNGGIAGLLTSDNDVNEPDDGTET